MSHIKEAVEALKAAQETPADENVTDPWLLTAQVHATLALVEQQRIANLIALAHVADLRDVTVSPLERAAWLALGVEGTGEPRPEIREALGIEASR